MQFFLPTCVTLPIVVRKTFNSAYFGEKRDVLYSQCITLYNAFQQLLIHVSRTRAPVLLNTNTHQLIPSGQALPRMEERRDLQQLILSPCLLVGPLQPAPWLVRRIYEETTIWDTNRFELICAYGLNTLADLVDLEWLSAMDQTRSSRDKSCLNVLTLL